MAPNQNNYNDYRWLILTGLAHGNCLLITFVLLASAKLGSHASLILVTFTGVLCVLSSVIPTPMFLVTGQTKSYIMEQITTNVSRQWLYGFFFIWGIFYPLLVPLWVNAYRASVRERLLRNIDLDVDQTGDKE